jgi:hypothetical protein
VQPTGVILTPAHSSAWRPPWIVASQPLVKAGAIDAEAATKAAAPSGGSRRRLPLAGLPPTPRACLAVGRVSGAREFAPARCGMFAAQARACVAQGSTERCARSRRRPRLMGMNCSTGQPRRWRSPRGRIAAMPASGASDAVGADAESYASSLASEMVGVYRPADGTPVPTT